MAGASRGAYELGPGISVPADLATRAPGLTREVFGHVHVCRQADLRDVRVCEATTGLCQSVKRAGQELRAWALTEVKILLWNDVGEVRPAGLSRAQPSVVAAANAGASMGLSAHLCRPTAMKKGLPAPSTPVPSRDQLEMVSAALQHRRLGV